MLLYPVYALLFADAGLSVAEISALFAVWSVSGLVLEVPSGVVADLVPRRLLLVLAPLPAGLGFGLWVAVPSVWAFAAGFVLWGLSGALRSGACEAYVHDQLLGLGVADRYAAVMGQMTAWETAGAAVAMGLATPAFAVGGYGALGAASVGACVAAAVVALRLPGDAGGGETSTSGGEMHIQSPGSSGCASRDDEASSAAGIAVLLAAVREVRRAPAVRRALLLVPGVVAVWGSLDEYLPLLAVSAGAATADVPLLALAVYAAMAAGGACAGWVATWRPRRFGLLLVGAAALLAAGALVRVPAGLLVIAVAFGGFQAATVAADARLQAAIDGPSRATVTSLAALLTEVAVLLVYGAYALGSAVLGDAALFALLAATYVPVAVLAARRVEG